MWAIARGRFRDTEPFEIPVAEPDEVAGFHRMWENDATGYRSNRDGRTVDLPLALAS